MYPKTWDGLVSIAEVSRVHRLEPELVRSWVRAGRLAARRPEGAGPTSAMYVDAAAVKVLATAHRAYTRKKAAARLGPKKKWRSRKRPGPPANVCRAGLEPDGSDSHDPIVQVQACRFLTPADHAEVARRRAKFEAARGHGAHG